MIKIYKKKEFYKKKVNKKNEIRKIVDNIYKKIKKNSNIVKSMIEKYDKIKGNILIKIKNIDFSKLETCKKNTIKVFIKKIFFFHKLQKKKLLKNWFFKKKNIKIGQINNPIKKIAIYVPGGNSGYVSSLVMNYVPAIIAGVKKIYVTTPAKGKFLLPILYACKILGIKKIYRIGGAHAIFSFSIGNKITPKVDKIIGPGNDFVNLAKKKVFGSVGIDSLAGPTELLIITDGKVKTNNIIYDLFAQLEHDINAKAFILSNNIYFLKRIKKYIIRKKIKNKVLKKSLKNLFIVYEKTIKRCIKISNKIAPEHLEYYANKKYLKHIKNAGAIFVGKNTCEVLGDYSSGLNHVLPTNSNSRFSSPLGVYDFIKLSNYLELKKSNKKEYLLSKNMSKIERLFYHYKSIKCRI
ncbi:histidinol dehydrogenase [Candidatus Vidania fulgoroideorum]